MYVIYDHPSDHPDKIVVRRWEMGGGGCAKPCEGTLFESIQDARAAMPRGLTRIERSEQDDPAIAEVWM